MIRSGLVFITLLVGLCMVAPRALADQTAPEPIVHSVDEALPGGAGGKIVHSGSLSWPSGSVEVLSFDFGTESPRDAASGLPSGKRQHSPITLVRPVDSSSPRLFQALSSGGPIKITEEGNSYLLRGISVVSTKPVKIVSATDTHELEVISFTFQMITVSNVSGKTGATDDWSAGGAPTPSPSPKH